MRCGVRRTASTAGNDGCCSHRTVSSAGPSGRGSRSMAASSHGCPHSASHHRRGFTGSREADGPVRGPTDGFRGCDPRSRRREGPIVDGVHHRPRRLRNLPDRPSRSFPNRTCTWLKQQSIERSHDPGRASACRGVPHRGYRRKHEAELADGLKPYHHFTRKNASSSTSIWLRVVSLTGVDAFSMTPMSDSHSQAMMMCSMS